MTREEYIKTHKAELKKQGFVYDEKTGDFIYVERGYINSKEQKPPKAKTKTKKK